MPLDKPVHSFIVKEMPEAAALQKVTHLLCRFNYGCGTAIADFPLAISL